MNANTDNPRPWKKDVTKGEWSISPLEGKYYGSRVNLPDGDVIVVWTPDHFASPFASEREIANGWEPQDGHDHVEDRASYANSRLLVEAANTLHQTGMTPGELAEQNAALAARVKELESEINAMVSELHGPTSRGS